MGNELERFQSKYKPLQNGCWEWKAAKGVGGYGRFSYKGRGECAHRASYMIYVGEIAEGMTIDHLCKNTSCVNPKHLEVTTQHENCIIRGSSPAAVNATKTHCKRGHEFDYENTYTYLSRGRQKRTCRKCEHNRYLKRKINKGVEDES